MYRYCFTAPASVRIPNGISIGSAISAGLKVVTNRQIDRPCYSVCSNRPHLASAAMRPNNCTEPQIWATIPKPTDCCCGKDDVPVTKYDNRLRNLSQRHTERQMQSEHFITSLRHTATQLTVPRKCLFPVFQLLLCLAQRTYVLGRRCAERHRRHVGLQQQPLVLACSRTNTNWFLFDTCNIKQKQQYTYNRSLI